MTSGGCLLFGFFFFGTVENVNVVAGNDSILFTQRKAISAAGLPPSARERTRQEWYTPTGGRGRRGGGEEEDTNRYLACTKLDSVVNPFTHAHTHTQLFWHEKPQVSFIDLQIALYAWGSTDELSLSRPTGGPSSSSGNWTSSLK
jgi:hypothetical protein